MSDFRDFAYVRSRPISDIMLDIKRLMAASEEVKQRSRENQRRLAELEKRISSMRAISSGVN